MKNVVSYLLFHNYRRRIKELEDENTILLRRLERKRRIKFSEN